MINFQYYNGMWPPPTKSVSSVEQFNFVDIVFVSEGYTALEYDKFVADVNRISLALLGEEFNELVEPFHTYSDFINIHSLFVASNESGYDQTEMGVYRDTFFNAESYFSDGRLIYGDEFKVKNFVQSQLPEEKIDIVAVLINSENYGGAGGLY